MGCEPSRTKLEGKHDLTDPQQQTKMSMSSTRIFIATPDRPCAHTGIRQSAYSSGAGGGCSWCHGGDREKAEVSVAVLHGELVPSPATATHCVVGCRYSFEELRPLLERCQQLGVQIVDISWLKSVELLGPDADHAAVILDDHRPPCLADLPSPKPTQRQPISNSLHETWGYLRREHPDAMAAEQLKRAMENSLIDFAILFQRAAAPTQSAVPQQSAAELLGVSEDADQAAIKQAYRRKALVAHPDKGGSVTAFLELQRAYRQLTQQAADSPRSVSGQIEADAQRALDIPERMRTHRNVVESW